jgi:hypothetical protein
MRAVCKLALAGVTKSVKNTGKFDKTRLPVAVQHIGRCTLFSRTRMLHRVALEPLMRALASNRTRGPCGIVQKPRIAKKCPSSASANPRDFGWTPKGQF